MARPPVAQLIYEHRMRLGLSVRESARRAGISEGSWRRTESTRKLTRTSETIARMASAVEITGDQLTGLGWAEAAAILAALRLPAPERERSLDDEIRDRLDRMDANIDRLIRAVLREPDDKEDENHEDNGGRRAS